MPEDLAEWLASLSRAEGAEEDEGPKGLVDLEPSARLCGRRDHGDWRERARALYRSRPFIPFWMIACLPMLSVSWGCGPTASSPPMIAERGGTDQERAVEPAPPSAVAVPEVEKVADPVEVAEVAKVADPSKEGARLYNRLCATCHGENGDGAGLAARFLYPRPRNFRQDQFRLVSTANMIPSDDDLMKTLEHGMPGSAMFSFGHLSIDDRKALVEHVRGLVRQGLEDRLKQEAAEVGEEPDLKEIAEVVRERTQPGPLLELPKEWPAEDAASIARGRDLYVKATCAACHGETGKGDGVQEQKDEQGMPIRPRDYTRGIFKGGRDRESLYARIALGVPGTPMPSSPVLKPDEIADLVHFIRSLSDPSTDAQVVHKRTTIHASKSEGPLPEAIPDSSWDGVEATTIVASPLWWRDDAAPDLRVQALHDGRDMAIRLSWKDATSNRRAIRVDEFPDMAAVQLFRGKDEPFLGMGAKESPVEVWLWNAAAQDDLKEYADVDTAHPNMVVDSYPFETPGDGPRPHATDRQKKEYITAWAAGNQRSDPTRPLSGSGLSAEGLGSATLRPPVAQDVKAQGEWKDGRWTVVLRRSMGDAPGGRMSIGFALWDGASRDRNGQKMVTIWHDLERR